VVTEHFPAGGYPSPSGFNNQTKQRKGVAIMDMKLEVLVLPVSDVDRAKRFYEKLGFRLDIDFTANENYRVIQFTPPGSEASIIFGKGVTSAQPGSIDRLLLAVYDIDAARDELLSHGVQVGEAFHDAGGSLGGGFIAGIEARALGPDPQRRSYGSYASFSDPDGNVWLLQEIKERLPGRTTHGSANGKATDILLETLKTAAAAHGVHEKEIGKPDPDWPRWYAEHMTRTLGISGYHLTGPSA
jgi:catechol 2,3-dioxygenase-like lactoylglutathione lyase family enzyme